MTSSSRTWALPPTSFVAVPSADGDRRPRHSQLAAILLKTGDGRTMQYIGSGGGAFPARELIVPGVRCGFLVSSSMSGDRWLGCVGGPGWEAAVRWCGARCLGVRVVGPVAGRCRPIGGVARLTGDAVQPLRDGRWPSPPGATRLGRGLAPMRPSIAARTPQPRACPPEPPEALRGRPAAAVPLCAPRPAEYGRPSPDAGGLRCPYQPIRRRSPSTNQPIRHVRLLPGSVSFQPTSADTYLTRHFPMDGHGVPEAQGSRRARDGLGRW